MLRYLHTFNFYFVAESWSQEIVNKKGLDDQTPIHYAADVGSIEIAKKLLDHNCRIQVLDATGKSPLYKSAHNNHPEFVKFLLTIK